MKAALSQRYILNIKILHTQPPVWRRLELPGNCNLAQLHGYIQALFAWSGEAEHIFRLNAQYFGKPGTAYEGKSVRNERKVSLEDIFPKARQPALLYLYDFEDQWLIEVFVEGIEAWNGPTSVSCLDGARAEPPESVGGPLGLAEAIALLSDPLDPDHEEGKTLLGDLDSLERFDIESANRRLNQAA